MTLDEFTATLTAATPPDVAPALIALWHDARGDWTRAHDVAQDVPDPDGAWVHAYLHRKEGDESNAGYWYRRARRSPAHGDLAVEWRQIVGALLSRSS